MKPMNFCMKIKQSPTTTNKSFIIIKEFDFDDKKFVNSLDDLMLLMDFRSLHKAPELLSYENRIMQNNTNGSYYLSYFNFYFLE